MEGKPVEVGAATRQVFHLHLVGWLTVRET